ncbi:MAG: glycogen/starch/alpha-glucan phosphorylase [Oscillospiraceae bacterium]|nr:glycogen/starch/alpha-glucan phosphorylase [Oscillospiraceae bacterium]
MDYTLSKQEAKTLLENKLSHFFGVNPGNATYEQLYRAMALILRDMTAEGRADFTEKALGEGLKRVYYLSMEFLMGRSLKNCLYNLNLTEVFEEVLADFSVSPEKIYDLEPDAGLGNGGLGRLAACYLDSLATLGYPAMGYSILYEYGIFKQKIIDGWQTELPDFWLRTSDVWFVKREESAVDVLFEGNVEEFWDEGYHSAELKNCVAIKAVPYDMFVPGKDGRGVSVLRLWSAEAPGFDMALFNQGEHLKAFERNATAEVISKVLYPADNHPEGKSLRLRQQYFLVSASVQDMIRRHLRTYSTLDSLSEKIAVHINDTHPTLAVPELMRIMLDECGYGWDKAWGIVTKTVAYTNHTVMKEALECWGTELLERLLPRIYQIICEIDRRFRAFVCEKTGNPEYAENTAIISNGAARMANLCVAACHSVNGVSALHSDILKNDVFRDFYLLTPEKFKNVTNGIAFRRWLCQANPALTDFIKGLIGDGFISDPRELFKLQNFKGDPAVLKEIEKIKLKNKERLSNYIKKSCGEAPDPASVFDVQIKRLHEYKRQHLNALQILAKYLEIKDDPDGNHLPQTFIFAAKAAPSYFMAKKIISFISALSKLINSDPQASRFLKVFYIEEYCVSKAEIIIPAAEISEQISLAGTEASGTGNMKLMLGGAVTLGTLDGANVEIMEAAGEENIIIFGMDTQEAAEIAKNYVPKNYYLNNRELKRAIDFIDAGGVLGQNFSEISSTIIHHDPYMVLADFADYRKARQKAEGLYKNRDAWNKTSLMNIASAGYFSSDRAVEEYAGKIWDVKGNVKIKV